ncbi:hypothetical protein [Novosphingobium album (ex Hu et al. 2023)]|uniref:Lipoprotein n=1 Tax=Novosphingobium album (ex Hu et al. 2023) TaxID=2930093 RepID=A0ABT0B7A6_9SPHN|nr:hypothetical protein [Novosphingobium album (ex Hu et al. 2023)]MCJ2180957.1 hypothetical protein [Novosphingobium album (ex Hu et al. 2023)]
MDGTRAKMLAWVLLAGACLPVQAHAQGVLPEGIWVLDQAQSVELAPGAQTLWVIKDDGQTLIWVNVARSPSGEVRVTSYSGEYGGAPAPVQGGPMMSSIASPGPGRIHNWGTVEGLGDYSEDCALTEGGKRFICHGKVMTSDGEKTWTDNFQWAGPSPDQPQTP